MSDAITHSLQPANLSVDRLERFLDRVEAIRHRYVIAGVLELGRAALEELYDGDFDRAHDRSAAQRASLATLLERNGRRASFLGITSERIRAALDVWEVNVHLPPLAQGRLLPTQLRCLSAIPSLSDRARLALDAVQSSANTEAIRQAVTTFRTANGVAGKGGRRPKHVLVKAVQRAQRALAELGDAGQVAALPVGTRAELRAALREVRAAADEWLVALG